MVETKPSEYQELVKSLKSSLESTVMGTIQATLLQVVELKPDQGANPSIVEMVIRIPEVPEPGELKVVTKVATFDRVTKKLIGLRPA